jgi:hypothetical protein
MVIHRVYLHGIFMIVIGIEGADQGEEEPSHHHVAPGMSLPYKPSQRWYRVLAWAGWGVRMVDDKSDLGTA